MTNEPRTPRTLPVPALQLITGSWSSLEDLESRVAAALAGGIRWVQLRAKQQSAGVLHAAAARLAPLLGEAGALFVVNDRIDVALATGAGGVHLPENGMSAARARAILGADAWIARSVHSVEAIRASAHSPLDAIQFGPVFETASKREFGAPQGTDGLAGAAIAAREAGFAVVAVGGITPARMGDCFGAGAAAVSLIGAIWDATDVEAAARAALRSLR